MERGECHPIESDWTVLLGCTHLFHLLFVQTMSSMGPRYFESQRASLCVMNRTSVDGISLSRWHSFSHEAPLPKVKDSLKRSNGSVEMNLQGLLRLKWLSCVNLPCWKVRIVTMRLPFPQQKHFPRLNTLSWPKESFGRICPGV